MYGQGLVVREFCKWLAGDRHFDFPPSTAHARRRPFAVRSAQQINHARGPRASWCVANFLEIPKKPAAVPLVAAGSSGRRVRSRGTDSGPTRPRVSLNVCKGWNPARPLSGRERGYRTFGSWQELAGSCLFAFGEQSVEADTTSSASAVSCRPRSDPVSPSKGPESGRLKLPQPVIPTRVKKDSSVASPVMAGEGHPSTTLPFATRKVVDADRSLPPDWFRGSA